MAGGQHRNNLAAIDATTGQARSWNPGVAGEVGGRPAPGHGSVFALALSGSTVYVGGDFTSIAGQQRTNLAALNAAA
jgi:hypothetical protein